MGKQNTPDYYTAKQFQEVALYCAAGIRKTSHSAMGPIGIQASMMIRTIDSIGTKHSALTSENV